MTDPLDAVALTTGAVLFDPGREVVRATGVDRVRFLHGIVTANVAGTPVGGAVHATLLTPKAHVVAEMRIFVRPDDLYIVGPAGQGGMLAAALARYAIMDDFAAAPVAGFSVHAVLGPAAGGRLAAVGIPVDALAERPAWSHADVATAEGTIWLARVRQLGVDGYWLGAPSERIAAALSALRATGLADLPADAAEAARIAALEPAWGREITEDYFPMEVGLNDTIDYSKGCFLGQEPIVRIRDRGHTNWRLVRLDVGATPSKAGRAPAPGDRLESDSKPKAGRVTSVALLPDGRAVALALAHVSVATGAAVRIVSDDGTRLADAIIVA